MSPVVRFAPSPTGFIHVGNARTALHNWLFAKKAAGTYILRFDDTDAARSRAEYADAILEDLRWLGMEPDRIARQSDRIGLYEAAAERLRETGALYPCYESAEELERQRARQRARGRPPIYDRSALKLSAEDRARLEGEGRKPHWRFLLPNFAGDPSAPHRTEVRWADLVRGDQAVDLSSVSDPVLVREDGTVLYTLTSVVDDIDMGVSHVIRGDDHVTNTGAQIGLFQALAAEPPVFGHHNLLQSETGEGLSKRNASLSLRTLRDDGIEPLAVAALAVLTGTSEPVVPVTSLDELAGLFDPSKVNMAATRLSSEELRSLNAKVLSHLPYEAVAARLQRLGIGGGGAFWEAVRGNLEKLQDAQTWWRLVSQPLAPDATGGIGAEDRAFVEEAAAMLPEEPWDEATWSKWTNAVKAATGRKGRQLFMPLRLALTGLSSGPELAPLLPVLGRPNTLARLSGQGRRPAQ
jgi:glutamyl-tRNA synthetase